MKQILLAMVLIIGFNGQVFPLDLPLQKKWQKTIGTNAPLVTDYWMDDGVPHFLVFDGNFAFIYTSGPEKWMSNGLPGPILCLQRIIFPEPIGAQILAGYTNGDHAEIARLGAVKLDSLTIINQRYFRSFLNDMGGVVYYNYQYLRFFLRPDTLADPGDFCVATCTGSHGSTWTDSWNDSWGQLHTINLDGTAKSKFIQNPPKNIPVDFCIADTSDPDQTYYIFSGRSYSSTQRKYDSYYSSTLYLMKNHFSEDTSTSRKLARSSESGSKACKVLGGDIAENNGEKHLFLAYTDKDATPTLAKIRLDDLSTADSLVLPFHALWSVIPVADPADVGESTRLLLISERGDVIPIDLADFSLGELYTLGYPVQKVFGWDTDLDGKDELFIQSGKILHCYEMPQLGTTVEETPLPQSTGIKHVYPNPFNSVTTIVYGVEQSGKITLDVVDINGRVWTKLMDGVQTAGSHTITWDAKGAPTGIYFVRLTDGSGRVAVRKVALVK